MDLDIHEHYVTFGVQYTVNPNYGEPTRLGMHKDVYAVIEAPDLDTATRIAKAVFEEQYSMVYTEADYSRRYQPDGEAMRIAWTYPWKGGAA